MTLKDVMAIILRYFAELSSLRGHVKVVNQLAITDVLPRNVIKYTN